MIEDKKLVELLSRRTELVNNKIKQIDDDKLAIYEKNLRIYKFLYNKKELTKKYLKFMEDKLSQNENSLLMFLITKEHYKSNQDFMKMITLEMKKEFYELELEKIGITYVPYQVEFELIRDELNNSNLSEEEESKNQLICELYDISLKMKILQRMGCSFV